MSEQLLQQVLDKLNQMDARFTNEINGLREDIAAFRKETSQAFVETHNKIDNRAKELQDQLDKHKRVLEALSLRSIEQETEIRDIKRIK